MVDIKKTLTEKYGDLTETEKKKKVKNEVPIVANEPIGTPTQMSIDQFLNSIKTNCDDSTKAIRKEINTLSKELDELIKKKEELEKKLKDYSEKGANKYSKQLKEELTKKLSVVNTKIKKLTKKLDRLIKKVKDKIKQFFPGQLEKLIEKMGPPISTLYNFLQAGIQPDPGALKDVLTAVLDYLTAPYLRYIKLALWWGENGPKAIDYSLKNIKKITDAIQELAALQSKVAQLASLNGISSMISTDCISNNSVLQDMQNSLNEAASEIKESSDSAVNKISDKIGN